MTHTFTSDAWVRVDTDPPQWIVVFEGQVMSTIQPFTVFDSEEEAVEGGFIPPRDFDDEFDGEFDGEDYEFGGEQ